MTIPKDKQEEFIDFFKGVLGPTFQKFGANKHELVKVVDEEIIGRQVLEKDRFIERVFFDESFHIPEYFAKVKADKKAWSLSRSYEERFNATNIELRVLEDV